MGKGPNLNFEPCLVYSHYLYLYLYSYLLFPLVFCGVSWVWEGSLSVTWDIAAVVSFLRFIVYLFISSFLFPLHNHDDHGYMNLDWAFFFFLFFFFFFSCKRQVLCLCMEYRVSW